MTHSSSLWTSSQIATATRGTASSLFTVTGISIDSRTVEPGHLFVALKGPNNNGHDYVDAALSNGAAGLLVSEGHAANQIKVTDTLEGLNALGIAARNRMSGKRIAVTGSVGKTTTKEILRQVFEAQGQTHASVGSFNNLWGVPLSLARMPEETDFGIFEVGMNHPGEIVPLTRLIRPDVAIVTNVAPVHTENFSSVEEIANAKAEIFEGLGYGGIAILNRDNEWYSHLTSKAAGRGIKILSFGEHEQADARLTMSSLHSHCSCNSAEILGQEVTFKVGAPGKHWALNALCALLCVAALRGDIARAALSLASVKIPQGRGQWTTVRTRTGTFRIIDESYNASPVAVAAALENLGGADVGKNNLGHPGRRIAVIGDMLELGEQAALLHASLADPVRERHIDLVMTAGKLSKSLHQALASDKAGLHATDAGELAQLIKSEIRDGDVVMVKGSRGSRMELVVQALQSLGQVEVEGDVQHVV